jgi:aryl sulfotransferase
MTMAEPNRTLSRTLFEASFRSVRFVHRAVQKLNDYMVHEHALRYVYRPRPDDVFIDTFPKSGTTLLQMMLYQMTTDGNMDIPHINRVSLWFEKEFQYSNGAALERMPSPRFFKTHLPYSKLPRGGKFIYLARDARDVAISFHHHRCLMSGQPFRVEDSVNGFLSEQPPFGSWFRHIESWWPHRNDPNVLFLRYEEVIADLPRAVRQVSSFCGVPVSEQDLPRIVERCSFDFMKRHTQKFDPRLHQVSTEVRDFIRKGIEGDGQDAFTREQNRRLARRLQELSAKLDCPEADPHSALIRPRFGSDVASEA